MGSCMNPKPRIKISYERDKAADGVYNPTLTDSEEW